MATYADLLYVGGGEPGTGNAEGGYQIGGNARANAWTNVHAFPSDYTKYGNPIIELTFYSAVAPSSWSSDFSFKVYVYYNNSKIGSFTVNSSSASSGFKSLGSSRYLMSVSTNRTMEPDDTISVECDGSNGGFVDGSSRCIYLMNATVYSNNATNIITLSYSANGGTGAPASQELELDSSGSAEFTVSKTTPTRSGYTFLGWHTSSSATSPIYYGGNTITLSEDDKLYAVWQKNPTYSINYNANGGANSPSSESQTVSPGSSAIFTVSDTVPTYEGYTFLGWSTSSAALTVEYVAGDEIDTTSNITLYAVWKENATHVITFDANGGEGEPDDMSCVSDSNGVATVTLPTSEPTRSGFIFMGWSEDDEATTATYTPGGSITLYGDVILYAVWKICVYLYTHMDSSEWDECADTFALYQNGALVYEFTKGDTNVYYAEEIDIGIYDLFINGADSGKNIIVSSSATSVTMDISYYTITYYAPDADSGSVPIDDTIYISGTTITISDNTGNLDKSNSLFIGWNTASDGSGTQYNVGDTINITSTLELYAMWADCYEIYDGESWRTCITKLFNGKTWRSAKLNVFNEEASE